MFSRKHPVLFISRHSIDSGRVILSREPFFEGGEALPYTLETLSEVIGRIPGINDRPLRIVLAEELVYVTALSFPRGTELTREMVRVRAEETIPEDLRATKWDFRTMRFVKHMETEDTLSVQVAVIEHAFSQALEKALRANGLTAESILPESYILASFERSEEGVTVIVEQNRESVLLMAALNGLVLMTTVKSGFFEVGMLERFVSSVGLVEKPIARIIASHVAESASFMSFASRGYQCLQKEYNPLLGVFVERVSGRDETVLNLSGTHAYSGNTWWQRIFRFGSSESA